mgnify:CR=1 FL=1
MISDEFLANVSLELRTPLTGVLAMTETLQAQTCGPLNERQLQLLQRMEHSGRHLLDTINAMLDLSRLDAGLLDLGVAVVVDEAYAEFAGTNYCRLVTEYPNLIGLRTMSKWAGLAGLRAARGAGAVRAKAAALRAGVTPDSVPCHCDRTHWHRAENYQRQSTPAGLSPAVAERRAGEKGSVRAAGK